MVFRSVWGEIEYLHPGNAVERVLNSPFDEPPSAPLYTDATSGETLYLKDRNHAIFGYMTVLKEQYGIQKDDVVLLFGFNMIWTPTIHLATIGLAGILSPANVMYTAEELAYQIQATNPKLLISADARADVAEEALKLAGSSAKLILTSAVSDNIRAIIADPEAKETAIVPVNGVEQHAYYCFSSGTSGLPKGVITTHQNIISNAIQQLQTKHPVWTTKNVSAAVLPMSHIYGLTTFIWCMTYREAHTVVFSKFDLVELLESIVKYKITSLVLVPPIILLLAKHPIVTKYPEIVDIVKYVKSGAAPCSKSTIALAQARLPKSHFGQGYGLTETSPVTHTDGYDPEHYDLSTVGWLLPGIEARLVDAETGLDVGLNTPGELWLRGPNIMKGYLNDPKSTAATLTPDRWLRTGDVAVIDKSGQYTIVDRIKELIKSKGHQVAPAELEALLISNPGIVDAAVVGVRDEDGVTEHPRAYVVLNEGVTPDEVVKWFNKSVAKHKRLWGGLVVLDAVPKSPSGKILRRFLRDRKVDTDVVHGLDLAKL